MNIEEIKAKFQEQKDARDKEKQDFIESYKEVEEKHRIKVLHRRYADFGSHVNLALRSEIEKFAFREDGAPVMYQCGGETIVKIYGPNKTYTGKTTCHSKEHFCKFEGRKRAFLRALEEMKKDATNQ